MSGGRNGMAAKEDKEEFLSRWSRLKQEARQPQNAPEKTARKMGGRTPGLNRSTSTPRGR